MDDLNREIPVVSVITGSDSDIPKIRPCIDAIAATGINVVGGIKSAHRTPDKLAAFSQALPDLALPAEVQALMGDAKIKVVCVIAAAGGSAHIAGMAAAETQTPIIALPVTSSAGGSLDATLSMLDMPPGIPNGFVPNNSVASTMAQKIVNLDIPEGYNGVALAPELANKIDTSLLEKLGIIIDENSPIIIHSQDLDFSTPDNIPTDKIGIVVPSTKEPFGPKNADGLGKMNRVAFYMGNQVKGKENLTNALIFAAQILGTKNPAITEKLKAYRSGLHSGVIEKDLALTAGQVPRIVAHQKVRKSGLWPENKTMNTSRGNEALETLGYVRFYTGKNADLYLIPDTEPLQILQVRTDRTSVLNIPLDLEVEGKGAIQNQISLIGAKFAENHGVQTMVRTLPNNIPEELRDRCQAIELGRQVEVDVNGKKEGIELIYRNKITGTLLKLLQGKTKFQLDLRVFLDACESNQPVTISKNADGDMTLSSKDTKFIIPEAHTRYFSFPDTEISTELLDKFFEAAKNPYQLDLPTNLKEWDDIRNKDGIATFTPTDKTKKDNPIPSHIVEKARPEIVTKLGQLFKEFTEFAYEKGYVLVDTKFEVFMNSQGQWCLGDEILTPESSRFIKVEDFNAGKYISADKQFIRELGHQFGWEKRWAELLASNPDATFLPVAHEVTEDDKTKVIAGYTSIQDAMKVAA